MKHHKKTPHYYSCGSRFIDFVGNLSKIDLDLGKTFVRVHRSYVVNEKRIKRVDRGNSEIELDNGEIIPMSRKGRKTLEG
ncbi:LytTR family transcriptional regulator DNA-binding domain-containing protein [Erysipelothrix piscisicarius]|uniref:LytTR family transcriptional regulator DNA-binding domain-containing protein n=1 Tax=Erysipelothrix piscisicarius TaxID=2485784 RepID=UPI001E356B49|nr:LytTR family DNA-binding domain-containing protein [Erysipelothrix piscisicarius]